MPTRVLVTDGNQRSTLAVVRALGAEGYDVIVGDTDAASLAARSRYCQAAFRYPSPYTFEESFVQTIARTAAERAVDLVIPMTDITSAVLAHQRNAVKARIAVVDDETFWRASDKVALHELADRIGVPNPTVRYVDGARSIGSLEGLPFPCIIKPARSRLRTEKGWVGTSVLRAKTSEELQRLLGEREELRYPFMVQREITGEGVGLFALCDRGEMKIVFAHRRLREKPPWGGVSVLREAIEPDAAALAHAEHLLRALQWHGVAMVEFKKEAATGTMHLMEVNGRFWGSLQLAIDAGINFPLHLVRLYLGGDIPIRPAYATGQRSRWLLGDLDHLLLRLKANGAAPSDAMPIGALLVDFCRFFRRDTRLEIESIHDPRPALFELRQYAANLLGGVRAFRR